MIRVVHFQRKPGPRAFSIERIFRDVRLHLPHDIVCDAHISQFASRGLFPRLRAILDASRHQGEVNHVTGDVHYLALGLVRKRTVLSIMDCGNLVRLRGWRRLVMRWLWFSWPISRSRVVTALSEATRRDLVELVGVAPERIRIVYATLAREFVAQPAAFNVRYPKILMVGTAPNKNLERMAEALSGLPCQIEVIGWATRAQRDAFAAHGLDAAILGDIGDAAMLAAYQRCDLLLFASTLEGFGMPIVEAQAVGRPVVTSNCSAMPEVAGGGACLVDPFDPASIRAGVDRVIRDTAYRDDLVQRGFVNAQRFSISKIASDYAAIYREVAGAAEV
jgi:glycosyltransferase involved in cell wall biosynthesis